MTYLVFFLLTLLSCSKGFIFPDNTKAGDADHINADLYNAAQNGDTQIVIELLNRGADVNRKDTIDNTSLMLAARNGHTEIVIELLNSNADVNNQNQLGINSLMLAAVKGHTQIVRELLNRDADVNTINTLRGATALMLAAQNGHTEIVIELLNRNADVNIRDKDGSTALIYAVRYGANIGTVTALLNYGANIPAADNVFRVDFSTDIDSLLNQYENFYKTYVLSLTAQTIKLYPNIVPKDFLASSITLKLGDKTWQLHQATNSEARKAILSLQGALGIPNNETNDEH